MSDIKTEYRRVLRIGAEIELCAIRSDIRRREMELVDLIRRNRFQMHCGLYWQLAMQTMCCCAPESCERIGNLCGRLIRFSRAIDISDVVSVELANNTISEVKREFQKLNDEMRVDVASRAFGLVDLVPAPEQTKQELREIWGRELQILGIQLPNNIVETLSETLATEWAQMQPQDGTNKKMSEAEWAATIIASMTEHFKTGTEQVNSDFVLRTIALTLAGLGSNLGKNRKEFLNFMANAWDEQMAARRKIDLAS